MSRRLSAALGLVALLLTVGCTKKEAPTHDHGHAHHEHLAPHGGTAVVLGRELYHLEFVRDAATGRLTAYILDGEMEKFIRLSAASFEITATVNGQPTLLVLKPVANPATGETVGDTAQFETQADWLKTTATFDAVISRLEIRGTVFTAVAFNFPAGNEP